MSSHFLQVRGDRDVACLTLLEYIQISPYRLVSESSSSRRGLVWQESVTISLAGWHAWCTGDFDSCTSIVRTPQSDPSRFNLLRLCVDGSLEVEETTELIIVHLKLWNNYVTIRTVHI